MSITTVNCRGKVVEQKSYIYDRNNTQSLAADRLRNDSSIKHYVFVKNAVGVLIGYRVQEIWFKKRY